LNATCANTAGAFTCTCNGGFTGDGETCVPIDTGCGCHSHDPGQPVLFVLGLGLIVLRRRRRSVAGSGT
jgi:MYXO-CTERM domain-containing protein